MNHPVLALAWHSWRLSRRWFLLLLGLATALASTLLLARPPMMPPEVPYQQIVAVPVFMLMYTLASFAGLLAVSAGNKHGFPYSFGYRLPVGRLTLTAVPMLFSALLCAALFALPLGLLRMLYGIPFPLIGGMLMIATCACFMLAAVWSTSGNYPRLVAAILAFVLILQLFSWMQPIAFEEVQGGGQIPDVSHIIQLGIVDGLILAGLVAILLWLTTTCVALQRRGETAEAHLMRALDGLDWRRGRRRALSGDMRSICDTLFDRLSLPCPTRSPVAAECWLELKRQCFPILVLSVAIALLIPLLYLIALFFDAAGSQEVAALSPLGVYFIGIGLALFNRRQAYGGYMGAFEATRALRTVQLAAIQILPAALAITIGMTLVEASLQLAEPLTAGLREIREPLIRFGSLVAPLSDAGPGVAAANQLMEALLFLSVIGLFSCLHSCSIFWGRWFLAGIVVVLSYAIAFLFRLRTDQTEIQTIINHMWAISGVIALLTICLLYRLYHLRVLGVKGLLALLAGALAGLLCSLIALKAQGYDLAKMAPEAQALTLALLLLPLVTAALTLWCYDRLRHGI